MCGLYGFINYGEVKHVDKKDSLLKELGYYCSVRGTDATGIAFNIDKKLEIDKAPEEGYSFKFNVPNDTKAVMGHVRRTTQGSEKRNYNNHPFRGYVDGTSFALAHNGVISNDRELARKLGLPKTKIETDSYVAVQLIEYFGALNMDACKFVAEQVEGMYTFTLLDNNDCLWIIKNDSPLVLIDFKTIGLIVYASTPEILLQSCIEWYDTKHILLDVLEGKTTVRYIKPSAGDIIKINPDGTIEEDKFQPKTYGYGRYYTRWDSWAYQGACLEDPYEIISREDDETTEYQSYYEKEIRKLCELNNIPVTVIDMLKDWGYTLIDIEDAIYSGQLEDLIEEIQEYEKEI